ncbi:MAG TPA: hypothetical protein VGM63_00210 [Mucilaginibacter sp.]|jgi:hypothetical protein
MGIIEKIRNVFRKLAKALAAIGSLLGGADKDAAKEPGNGDGTIQS